MSADGSMSGAGTPPAPDRLMRARRALKVSGRRLMQLAGGSWAVLADGDRRRRAVVELAAHEGATLLAEGRLVPAEGGGYVLAAGAPAPAEPEAAPGPGIFLAVGAPRSRQGGAGFVGLARRAAEAGAVLSLRQVRAGLRLIADAERSLSVPGLTMDWDAVPSSRGRRAGQAGGIAASARAATVRIAKLREAAGDGLALAWAACVEGRPLSRIESRFGLAARSGAAQLAKALEKIARAYDTLAE